MAKPSTDYAITHKLLIDYLDYAEGALANNQDYVLFGAEAFKKLNNAHLKLLKAAETAVVFRDVDALRQLIDSYYPEEDEE